MTGPGFVCIGAQKAGTTWLYRALEHRPDIWLPPVKELHYFDEKRVTPRPWYENFRGDDGIAQRWRRQLGTERRRRVHESQRSDGAELRRWSARYFFETPTPEWYASLFPDGRLGGDITPEYAFLDPAGIDAALQINPELRVIYLLRNPIEREWSGALMRSRGLGRSTDLVLRGGRRRHARYAENLDRWRARLQPGHLYIGWFDDIAQHPQALLSDVLTFLQVSTANPAPPSGRPNSGGASTIPGRYAAPLARELGPAIHDLAQRFAGPAERWAATTRVLETAAPDEEIPYPFVSQDVPDSAEISSIIL